MLWFLLACQTDVVHDGTLVGNAGSGKGQVAPNINATCETPQMIVNEIQYLDHHRRIMHSVQGQWNLFEYFPIEQGRYEHLLISVEGGTITCFVDGGSTITLPKVSNNRFSSEDFEDQFSALQSTQEQKEFDMEPHTWDFLMTEDIRNSSYILQIGIQDWIYDEDPVWLLKEASVLYWDRNENGTLDSSENQKVGIESYFQNAGDTSTTEDVENQDEDDDWDDDWDNRWGHGWGWGHGWNWGYGWGSGQANVEDTGDTGDTGR